MKKNIKKIIASALLGLLVQTSYGQQGNLGLEGNALNIRLSSMGETESYSSISGSPYVQENFLPANILKEGQKKEYRVRYDAYKEKIQVQVNESQIMNLNHEAEYEIVFVGDEKRYIPIRYDDGVAGFGVLLWENADGKRLFKRERIELLPGQESNGYLNAKGPSFSEVQNTYYFVDKGFIRQVSLGQKIFKEMFDESLKNKAKKEKLNLKQEEDFIQLFEWAFSE